MKIKWNGHASFTITAADGTAIVTDPYTPGGFGGAFGYDAVKDYADAVLVSHEHGDHNYVDELGGSPQVLKGAGQVKDITVKAIEAFHDESNGSERGTNTLFSFNMDGINVCFLGDLGHQLSSEQIQAIGPVDVLMVPVGGNFTVDAGGAANVVDTLGPKLVIPMHYKTEKCSIPIAGVDGFLEQMENHKALEVSEIDLSPDKLPADGPEVWVMKYAC